MSEQIIIGVPGVWQNHTEVSQAIAAQNNDFIFAGFTLMDTATQDVAFVELHDHDPRLVDVFETLGESSINDQDLEKIAAHRSTLWVLSPEVSIQQARRMMEVGRTLLNAGGLAVKVESSGVAHSARRWHEFAVSDDLQQMYCAYVNLIEGDDYIYSCGMHNFGLPSTLKAWIDHVARAERTFSYGANGPQGLLARKKVVVITSRGAAYEKGTAREAFDFQEPYLLHILAFIGLTDVTFIHAENQAREEADVFFSAAAERIGGIVIDQDQQVVAL